MLITIKLNTQMQIFKIYFLKFVDREIVNQIFNILYIQNRMKYFKQFIFFDYFVFIV